MEEARTELAHPLRALAWIALGPPIQLVGLVAFFGALSVVPMPSYAVTALLVWASLSVVRAAWRYAQSAVVGAPRPLLLLVPVLDPREAFAWGVGLIGVGVGSAALLSVMRVATDLLQLDAAALRLVFPTVMVPVALAVLSVLFLPLAALSGPGSRGARLENLRRVTASDLILPALGLWLVVWIPFMALTIFVVVDPESSDLLFAMALGKLAIGLFLFLQVHAVPFPVVLAYERMVRRIG